MELTTEPLPSLPTSSNIHLHLQIQALCVVALPSQNIPSEAVSLTHPTPPHHRALIPHGLRRFTDVSRCAPLRAPSAVL
ncbi:hypothetical protein EYF80_037857 [Liparis tanakae]|uniref:Uncharacterized protein n=1 Tax=Liparis tanakae TaxID=230148 RepID=A0A4Z2GF90_9TELE|nr:hypothetical protein EYF80_037857 [Liparis tanakae]